MGDNKSLAGQQAGQQAAPGGSTGYKLRFARDEKRAKTDALEGELDIVRRIIIELPRETQVFGTRRLNEKVDICILAFRMRLLHPLLTRCGMLSDDTFTECEAGMRKIISIRRKRLLWKCIRVLFSYVPATIFLGVGFTGMASGITNAVCWIESGEKCGACVLNIGVKTPGADVQYVEYEIQTKWSYYSQKYVIDGDHFACCPSSMNCCDFFSRDSGAWCDRYGSLGQGTCPTAFPWACSYYTAPEGILLQMAADTSSWPLAMVGLVLLGLAMLYWPVIPCVRFLAVHAYRKYKHQICAVVDRNLVIELSMFTEDERDEMRKRAGGSANIDPKHEGMGAEFGERERRKLLRPMLPPLFPARTLVDTFPKKYATDVEPNPALFMDAWELSKWHWPEDVSEKKQTPKVVGRHPKIKRSFSSQRRKHQRTEWSTSFGLPRLCSSDTQVAQFRASTPSLGVGNFKWPGYRAFTRYEEANVDEKRTSPNM